MVFRESRRYSNTPEEKERLARKACPNCGCERSHFNLWNRDAICCRPSCSTEYWGRQPTIAEMRRLVLDEQEGTCAHCKQEIPAFNTTEGPYNSHHYVMDHIRPIAMGGDQWARENLQVLCKRCNRIKTARDMGKIARWKKYYGRGPTLQEDNSRQVLLFLEDLT
jgi:5-methylcytosine-specific restriction endonuclease McrA